MNKIELFPTIQLTWLGGWILLIINSLIPIISLKLLPKKIASRLLDRSTFTKKQKEWTIISKLITLGVMIFCFLTPLISGWELFLGLIIFIIGDIGLIIAFINFKNTPLDEPVVKGFYKISRHPQEVALSIAMLGIVIAVGSGIALILFLVSRIPFHFRILAEEEACLQQYGESYKEYMKQVPRYFLFF